MQDEGLYTSTCATLSLYGQRNPGEKAGGGRGNREREPQEPTPRRRAPDQGRAARGRKGKQNGEGGGKKGRGEGERWEGGGANPTPDRYSVTHHGLLGEGLRTAIPCVSVDRGGLQGARGNRPVILRYPRESQTAPTPLAKPHAAITLSPQVRSSCAQECPEPRTPRFGRARRSGKLGPRKAGKGREERGGGETPTRL